MPTDAGSSVSRSVPSRPCSTIAPTWRLAADPAGRDPGEVALTVSLAKAWVSEAYQRVCALGHQVHGAIGFTAEHDLHHYLQHATSAALAFGDGDFHADRVADGIGLPRS